MAFDTEMVVGVDRQFGCSASGFQHPLCQLDTGGDSRTIHLFDGNTFIFFDERFATVRRSSTYVNTYKTQK
jgi:hypothetical protein